MCARLVGEQAKGEGQNVLVLPKQTTLAQASLLPDEEVLHLVPVMSGFKEEDDDSANTYKTLQYCIECNNLLYPREDRVERRLIYACRNCEYSEAAAQTLIFRNELLSKEGETAGVTQDVGDDPTLPRSDKVCPRCGNNKCVFFQSQQRKAETKMTLFYVCVECGKIFEDALAET